METGKYSCSDKMEAIEYRNKERITRRSDEYKLDKRQQM